MDYFFSFNKMKYFREKKPDGCILCLIHEGSAAVEDLTVFRSELVSVTVNLYPYNPGHLLVFPNRHITDMRQLTSAEEEEISRITKYSLNILDKLFAPTGYNIGYNMGLDAGGSIDHLHRHIIPRYPREIGIAELIGGKKILVESPYDTADKLRAAFISFPSQDSVL
ncbi:MAG: HIT domain-containing protein [Spirochaetales bacterium]|nr:HIT domain-containing protein [Spirochaetales bacterium]